MPLTPEEIRDRAEMAVVYEGDMYDQAIRKWALATELLHDIALDYADRIERARTVEWSNE